MRRGEPFAHLPPPADAKDAGSRAQLGPAIVLHRELTRRGHPEARAIVAQAVHAGALAFLGRTVGPISRQALGGMTPAERRTWLAALGERFPNATLSWEATGPDRVSFRVTACRFVALCRAVGAADLAPLFCAGDATFFGTVEPDVRLDRPHTLAEGGPDCPFTLSWKEAP
ncbi:MAG: L-2-amino-thiazoline-4-carboxylic acid hydrolase [Myxococcales bacterium]|nr:L-2-amino-thiazoline-4-carboxylic acid hydrolase [Myxococcales bacterium]MCB9525491.1 L-2-amino-thiazoline-4-carboxylic acid hydrolase [Myxococcales bacterium]